MGLSRQHYGRLHVHTPSRVVRTPQSYLRAILTGDGVAIFWVLDKRHIHANQGSPIRSYHLASDERNQAERENIWAFEPHAGEQRDGGSLSPTSWMATPHASSSGL